MRKLCLLLILAFLPLPALADSNLPVQSGVGASQLQGSAAQTDTSGSSSTLQPAGDTGGSTSGNQLQNSTDQATRSLLSSEADGAPSPQSGSDESDNGSGLPIEGAVGLFALAGLVTQRRRLAGLFGQIFKFLKR